MKPNQLDKVIRSFEAQGIDCDIPETIAENESKYYHVVAIRTKLKGAKAVHDVRVMKYDPKTYAKVSGFGFGKLGFSTTEILHNPTLKSQPVEESNGLQKIYVDEIKARIEAGESIKDLAKEYGTTQKAIKEL